MLVGPLRSLGVTLNLAQRATASGARIFQMLDREPTIADPPGAPPLPAGNGHVQLRDVTLRYSDPHDELNVSTYAHAGRRADGANAATQNGHTAPAAARRTVLHDLDLDVPAGRTVALVGATGSGKTSLVALISRLYDPVEGEVLLDGADVRDVGLQSLRSAVAVVSDDPFLFSASVAENIAYARAAT